MKIKKNDNTKKRRLVIIVILILLICVITFFAWKVANDNSDRSETPNDTQQAVDTPEQPNNNVNQPSDNSSENEKDVTTPEDNSSHTVTTPIITYAAEIDGLISVAAQLDGDDIAGICRLTLQKTGEVDIVRDSAINHTTHYTCSIDNVPVPSSGSWTARVTNIVGGNESEPAILEVPY